MPKAVVNDKVEQELPTVTKHADQSDKAPSVKSSVKGSVKSSVKGSVKK